MATNKEVIKLLERAQRRAEKTVGDLKGKSFEEWVRIPGVLIPEKRTLRRDLIAVYNFLVRRRGEVDTDLSADQ